jgi:hypothetical protein
MIGNNVKKYLLDFYFFYYIVIILAWIIYKKLC